jgi:hypothetical protein
MAEPALLVKNTSDISAMMTFGSAPDSGGDMTDKGDDDTADVTVYVSYLVEAEIESQPREDLLLPASPLLLDRQEFGAAAPSGPEVPAPRERQRHCTLFGWPVSRRLRAKAPAGNATGDYGVCGGYAVAIRTSATTPNVARKTSSAMPIGLGPSRWRAYRQPSITTTTKITAAPRAARITTSTAQRIR